MIRISLRTMGALLCLLVATPAPAQWVAELSADARTEGMGGVGIAVGEGPTASSMNPALLGLEREWRAHVNLPIHLVNPTLSRWSLREFGLSTPLPIDSSWRPVVGLQYRRLYVGAMRSAFEPEGTVGSREADEIFGLTLAARPHESLAVGVAARRIRQVIYEADAWSFDAGVLGRHRLVERDDAFVEGRVGLVWRRAGGDFDYVPTTSPGVLYVEPQTEELGGGAALLFQGRESRLTLAADLVDPIYAGSEDRSGTYSDDLRFDRFFGMELQVLTVAARFGHRDQPISRIDDHGFGVILPFPRGVTARADYARLPWESGLVRDLYSFSLSYAGAGSAPRLWDGRRVRGRLAVGILGPGNEPDDLVWNPGPSLRASSLVELGEGLDLESWVGWAWLGTTENGGADVDDATWTFAQLGAGLRRTLDLGAARPYLTGGVGGFRLGEGYETSDGETGRQQLIRAGYALGLGVELRSQEGHRPGADVELRLVHHDGFGAETKGLHWELSVGVLFE